MMTFGTLAFVIISWVVAGSSRDVLHIQKQEGETITFTCTLGDQDLTTYSLDWKIVDAKYKRMNVPNDIVHSYRGGQDHPSPQMPEYINRTELDREDLKNGIVTLKITSAQVSDSRNYKCYVPKWNKSCFFECSVEKKNLEEKVDLPDEKVTSATKLGGSTVNVRRIIAIVPSVCVFLTVCAFLIWRKKKNVIQHLMREIYQKYTTQQVDNNTVRRNHMELVCCN